MFSVIFAAFMMFAIIAAIVGAFLLAYILIYIPISAQSCGFERLGYGEFRALYAAAPNDWEEDSLGVTYKGQGRWMYFYFVGIGQLCYWVWYSRQRLAQLKEENQESRERLFQAIQESKH
ncbi:MAG: hypothetical protein LUD84_11040 [Clostridiales bacterium]|nr:hypothetical protein [Clostridiales bacterium]